jgi:hypothetical protein
MTDFTPNNQRIPMIKTMYSNCHHTRAVIRRLNFIALAILILIAVMALTGCADTRTIVHAKSVTITETAPRIVVDVRGLPLSMP